MYITNTRNTRIMWTVWAICLVALLATLSNRLGLPAVEFNADPMPLANGGLGCITDSECEGLAPSDNINLSIKGE